MIVRLISPAVVSPWLTSDALEWLRIDDTTDSTLVASVVDSARMYIEGVTGLAIGSQTRELVLRRWPRTFDLSLPGAPLVSVSSVIYGAGDVTLATSVYEVDTYQFPGRILLKAGQSWPTDSLVVGPLRVRFACGYTSADLPGDLLEAWKMLAAHYFENREAVLASAEQRAEVAVVPLGVASILDQYVML